MFLGVDGGGTKTAFILVDDRGAVLAEHVMSGSYYLDLGIDAVRTLLETGVRQVTAKVGATSAEVEYAFFGLPAYGEDSRIVPQLDDLPRSVLPAGNYRCDNDVVCAWAGSLGCGDGISIVAGTGSIAYGRRGEASARCGGWGEVFGDEGSAYWIGREGLRLFSRMSDGRLARGPLYEKMRERFALGHDLDLSGTIIEAWKSSRAAIATLSLLVAESASAGDEAAIAIFRAAAAELAELAEGVCARLSWPTAGPRAPLSFSGGVFEAREVVLTPLRRRLESARWQFDLQAPRFPPAVGAALYAGLLAGCPSIRQTLHRER